LLSGPKVIVGPAMADAARPNASAAEALNLVIVFILEFPDS
jgi:hypothetical protein